MFCTNCGRELQEGEVCNCTQTNGNPPVQENANAFQPQEPRNEFDYAQQPEYYNPEANNYVGAYYDPTQAYNNQDDPSVNKEIPARTDYPEGYKIKKKHVAVILALFVGVFGIHNYYLGNSSKGLAQLLVATVGSIFTFGLSAIAVSIWATVEAVLLLTENIDRDQNGFKIQTFEESLAKELKKD